MFCQYVLLFVAVASVGRVTCWRGYTAISHINSNLVLDGSEKEVKLQRFTGSDSQLWRKESAGGGKYYIRNKDTHKLLDIPTTSARSKVITSRKLIIARNMKWYINSDDTIENAYTDKLVLDIPDYDVKPGVSLIVFDNKGGSNQKFRFEDRKL